ncbi:atrial natriuretic peptide receptor 1-like [Mytilus galloprovincialis]|uniref:atrial natriuretic peptide receptor 1-like n=1 Tax=Mytilus galloprovincialis TaxID=29158 RepID=UPI003F7C54EB
MKNRVFHGISGKISIDKNGDREPDFQLLDMNMDSGDFVIVAEYFGSIGTMVFRNETSIHWPSDRGPPKNIPDCGFKGDNPHCKVKEFNSTGLIAGLFVAVFLVVVVAGLIMNRLND